MKLVYVRIADFIDCSYTAIFNIGLQKTSCKASLLLRMIPKFGQDMAISIKTQTYYAT